MKSVGPKLVAIKTFPLEDEGVIKDTEISREAAMKKQNRGKVILIGNKCDTWIEVGDTVSYYRNAATTLKDEDGSDIEVVNEAHVLASF